MNRIKSLNAHFAPPSTHVAVRKGNFTDSFSYLNLDKYLSAEGIELRNKTREFMAYVEKSMYDNTETAEMPMWVVPAMGKLGIVGADLPKEYGGKAMNMTDLGVCMYELAYGDASVSTFFLLHNSLSHYTVLKLAQEELRRRIFAETLDCKKILCWCLTEPENGSDASGLRTTAKKVYNWVDGKVVKGYVINGQKRWIGNAPIADLFCVWARNESLPGHPIQCFLVKKGTPGLTVRKIERKLALRAVQNGHIWFEDVFVPEEDHFELALDFASGTKDVLQHSRVFVCWEAAGMAAGACDAAMEYCQKRIQFKKPIAQFQMIQAQLVRAVGLTQQIQLLCLQISRLYDRGQITMGRIAMAKAEATANCREVCKLARNVMGGNGILLENKAMKMLTDIEAIHTYEGTHEINTLVAGREMTELSAIR